MLAEIRLLNDAAARLRTGSSPQPAQLVDSLRAAWNSICEYCFAVRDCDFDGKSEFADALIAIEQAADAALPEPWCDRDLRRVRWYRFLFNVLTTEGHEALRAVLAEAADRVSEGSDLMQLVETHDSASL